MKVYVAINDSAPEPAAVEVFVDLESMNNFLATHPGWVAANTKGYTPCYCTPAGSREV